METSALNITRQPGMEIQPSGIPFSTTLNFLADRAGGMFQDRSHLETNLNATGGQLKGVLESLEKAKIRPVPASWAEASQNMPALDSARVREKKNILPGAVGRTLGVGLMLGLMVNPTVGMAVAGASAFKGLYDYTLQGLRIAKSPEAALKNISKAEEEAQKALKRAEEALKEKKEKKRKKKIPNWFPYVTLPKTVVAGGAIGAITGFSAGSGGGLPGAMAGAVTGGLVGAIFGPALLHRGDIKMHEENVTRRRVRTKGPKWGFTRRKGFLGGFIPADTEATGVLYGIPVSLKVGGNDSNRPNREAWDKKKEKTGPQLRPLRWFDRIGDAWEKGFSVKWIGGRDEKEEEKLVRASKAELYGAQQQMNRALKALGATVGPHQIAGHALA